MNGNIGYALSSLDDTREHVFVIHPRLLATISYDMDGIGTSTLRL